MRDGITIAARSAGRDPASVTLIGVAKSQAVERVAEALDAGLSDLGENYVQEARAHFDALGGRTFRRHFIAGEPALAQVERVVLRSLDLPDIGVLVRGHERRLAALVEPVTPPARHLAALLWPGEAAVDAQRGLYF